MLDVTSPIVGNQGVAKVDFVARELVADQLGENARFQVMEGAHVVAENERTKGATTR
jgi:hypothetical protein